MNERDRYLAARAGIRRKKQFLAHLAIWVVVIGISGIISLRGEGLNLAFFVVAAAGAISLALHFLMLVTGLIRKHEERTLRILLEMLEEEQSRVRQDAERRLTRHRG